MTEATSSTDGAAPKGRHGWAAVAEWVLIALVAVVIAFVVQRFLFQAFFIPSRSMEPTLSVGDRVLVNKLSYRLHDVRRGDLVVFEAPEGQQTTQIEDFVKRVIALGGETIEWREENGQQLVYIDGQLLDEPYLPPHAQGQTTIEGPPPGCAESADAPYVSCTLAPGTVLVMGDNRTQSKDGRVFGPIPEDAIVGRVFLHIWPPTITWLYLGGILAALVIAFFGLRALLRRRRGTAPPPGGPEAGPPSHDAGGDGGAHAESSSRTAATINWTRSE